MKSIRLRGAEQNNLKNINLDIPLGSMTVVCGPSGSGKSSLAFETLYSEGQRRYIESLSNYTKQFLDKAPKPKIESIENIPPSIALDQKNRVKSSRSTVGTTTEILDYLRLLFEKSGKSQCPVHNCDLVKDSPVSAAKKVIKNFKDQRGYVLALVSKEERIVDFTGLLKLLKTEGFARLYIPPSLKKSKTKKVSKNKITKKFSIKIKTSAAQILEINEIDLKKQSLLKSDFYIIIDRMVFSEEDQSRLIDSLSQAFQFYNKYQKSFSPAKAFVLTAEGEFTKFSENHSCPLPQCEYESDSIDARYLNFNNPFGACEECKGFGNILSVDIEKIIPNTNLSLAEGAIRTFEMPSGKKHKKKLIEFCQKNKISITKPWSKLTAGHQKKIWEGDRGFYGVMGVFKKLERKKYKMHVRVFLAKHKSPVICSSCEGSRLKKEALRVLLDGKNINEYSMMTLSELHQFIKGIDFSEEQKKICKDAVEQLQSRLEFLIDAGVGYLTLQRPTKTLSGGEYQRLSLSNQLGLGLSQVLYVLDEPTIGLHPRDSHKLIKILDRIKNLGNTLVVVEHDLDMIKNGSHIIEMGPGSGHLGGKVIFSGDYKSFISNPDSNTASYLDIKSQTPAPISRPVKISTYKYQLELHGCSGNNLKKINVKFPLNRLVTVTGVSGSGKSSLVGQTLYPALAKSLGIEHGPSLPYKSIKGFEYLKNVLFVNQISLGRTTRSNSMTYLKIFDLIRKIFASTEAAQKMCLRPGDFSLNVSGGRCPECEGLGYEVIDMMFMDDIHIPCESCDEKKYQDKILSIKYKDKNIYEVLNMTVSEAMDFFISYPNIRRPLSLLCRVGLEYIQLGQSTSSLSGGEAQRLVIARELNNSNSKTTLYIFDEPTTGLHFREVYLLLKVLHQLVDAGNSVLLIEHNLEIIKHSDYVIDMGPEAADGGGEIIAQGSPLDLIKNKKSITGKYLKEHLGIDETKESSVPRRSGKPRKLRNPSKARVSL